MVIYKDEEMYGFIEDILDELESEIELDSDNDNEMLKQAVDDAKSIKNNNDYPECMYKCWFNPMGAYVFSKLVEEK